MYRRILAGYQEGGREALELALALAEPAGAQVTVATVLDAPDYRFVGDVLRAELEREARSAIDRVTGDWPRSVKVTSRVLRGRSPARALRMLAEEERSDVLVLGSTHRGRIGDAVLGSTAGNVLRGAPCAVAIAPQRAQGR